jgi:hypothetical protein
MPRDPERSHAERRDHAPSIERFAVLCALIDDGFAPRADILATSGPDGAGWQAFRVEWGARLSAHGARELLRAVGSEQSLVP